MAALPVKCNFIVCRVGKASWMAVPKVFNPVHHARKNFGTAIGASQDYVYRSWFPHAPEAVLYITPAKTLGQPPARFRITYIAHGIRMRRRQSQFLLRCCCFVAGKVRLRACTASRDCFTASAKHRKRYKISLLFSPLFFPPSYCLFTLPHPPQVGRSLFSCGLREQNSCTAVYR